MESSGDAALASDKSSDLASQILIFLVKKMDWKMLSNEKGFEIHFSNGEALIHVNLKAW